MSVAKMKEHAKSEGRTHACQVETSRLQLY